jgi:hypothetical protein
VQGTDAAVSRGRPAFDQSFGSEAIGKADRPCVRQAHADRQHSYRKPRLVREQR